MPYRSDKTGSELRRSLFFGLLMLPVYVLHSVPGILPAVFGTAPLPLVPLAVIIAMYEGEFGGALFGLLAGMLMDTHAVHTAGFSALTLMLLCFGTGLLIRRYMRNTLLSCMLLSFCVCTLYVVLQWLCFYLAPGKDRPLKYLMTHGTVRILYSAALCVPLYLLIRRLTRKRRPKRR